MLNMPNWLKASGFIRKVFYLAVINIFCLASSCTNSEKEIQRVKDSNEVMATEQITNLRLTYSDSAITRVLLTAPVMKHFTVNVKEKYMIMDKGFNAIFYDDSSHVKSTMKGNMGQSFDLTNNLLAKGNVEIVNDKKEKLETEEIFWNKVTKRITSNTNVKITTADKILYGKGIDASEDFSEYTIKQITGTVMLNQE